jgi:hypothetical protein
MKARDSPGDGQSTTVNQWVEAPLSGHSHVAMEPSHFSVGSLFGVCTCYSFKDLTGNNPASGVLYASPDIPTSWYVMVERVGVLNLMRRTRPDELRVFRAPWQSSIYGMYT